MSIQNKLIGIGILGVVVSLPLGGYFSYKSHNPSPELEAYYSIVKQLPSENPDPKVFEIYKEMKQDPRIIEEDQQVRRDGTIATALAIATVGSLGSLVLGVCGPQEIRKKKGEF